MAKQEPSSAQVESKTEVAPTRDRNFRARIAYKSGSRQDFQVVAMSTTLFELMRKAFLGCHNNGTPRSGFCTLMPCNVVVDWTQVASFHEWVD